MLLHMSCISVHPASQLNAAPAVACWWCQTALLITTAVQNCWCMCRALPSDKRRQLLSLLVLLCVSKSISEHQLLRKLLSLCLAHLVFFARLMGITPHHVPVSCLVKFFVQPLVCCSHTACLFDAVQMATMPFRQAAWHYWSKNCSHTARPKPCFPFWCRCQSIEILVIREHTSAGDTSALMPGGVRMGAPALTSRGFTEDDFVQVANFVDRSVTDVSHKTPHCDRANHGFCQCFVLPVSSLQRCLAVFWFCCTLMRYTHSITRSWSP